MPTDIADLRASDADRERIVALLGEQTGQGRLSLQEMDERAARAYAARTLDELETLVADLPNTAARPPVAHQRPARCPAPRLLWTKWAVAVAVCLLVWTATALRSDELPYFWPIWVAGPWGLVLLARTTTHRRLS